MKTLVIIPSRLEATRLPGKPLLKINNNFDLSPRGIRELLDLNKPIYEITAAYGHFGRKSNEKGEFSWEKTDKTNIFKL